MKRGIWLSLVLFFLFASGCIPGFEKPPVVSTRPELKTAPLVSPEILDERIIFYAGLLRNGHLSDKEREIASSVLKSYQLVKQISTHGINEAEYRRACQDLIKSLGLLERDYFSKDRKPPGNHSASISLFSRKRGKILDTYLAGDFKGVINQCVELKNVFGPDALTPEIGLLFALSLAEEEMLDEAANIGMRIAGELEMAPDLLYLRTAMAEWQLSLDHRQEALHIYEKLTDDLDEREAQLKSLSGKIVKSPVPHTVVEDIGEEERPHRVLEHGMTPIDQLLLDVDELVQRHAYRDARFLLVRHMIRTAEAADIEIIEQALKSVDLAEIRFEEEKHVGDNLQKQALVAARKLMDQEEFEAAITKLTEIEGMQEDDSEAQALKEQVIERLINRERNRAAKLFLAAKKATDPEKKASHLRSSRNILKALINKYPTSSLISKLKSHMKIVEKELDKIGKDIE